MAEVWTGRVESAHLLFEARASAPDAILPTAALAPLESYFPAHPERRTGASEGVAVVAAAAAAVVDIDVLLNDEPRVPR